jgi:hypothetical protein
MVSSYGYRMKRSGSPMLLFENLDLTPIRSILWTGLHRKGPGRPVEYKPECDLRALMLRQLEQIPYVKDLVKRLRRDRSIRTACGYGSHVPTEAHFSQMKQRIGIHGFRAIEAWLRRQARAALSRLCEKSNLAQELASCMHRIRLEVQLCNHKTSNFLKPSRVFTQSLSLNWCKVVIILIFWFGGSFVVCIRF